MLEVGGGGGGGGGRSRRGSGISQEHLLSVHDNDDHVNDNDDVNVNVNVNVNVMVKSTGAPPLGHFMLMMKCQRHTRFLYGLLQGVPPKSWFSSISSACHLRHMGQFGP